MKIRLSSDEVYEIKLPEEIGINEFQSIVSKFNFLLKNFTKFNIGDTQPIEKGEIVLEQSEARKNRQQDKTKWKFLRDNRNAYIDILKTYYLGTKEEFENIIKKYSINLERQQISSIMGVALREMHKVKPQEVGLSGFPTKQNPVWKLKLNQGDK